MQHYLDIAGSFFSFLSTFFYVLASQFAWPLGVVATLLNSTLYAMAGIYGDMVLEAIYLGSMLYGWYQWRYGGKNHKSLTIRHIGTRTLMLLLTLAMLGFLLGYLVLRFLTHSTVPVADAFTTAFSLLAQWMTCLKVIECWLVWLVVDIIYVSLYFNKDLPMHSLLLLIYVGMAVVGYWHWYKKIQRGR